MYGDGIQPVNPNEPAPVNPDPVPVEPWNGLYKPNIFQSTFTLQENGKIKGSLAFTVSPFNPPDPAFKVHMLVSVKGSGVWATLASGDSVYSPTLQCSWCVLEATPPPSTVGWDLYFVISQSPTTPGDPLNIIGWTKELPVGQ